MLVERIITALNTDQFIRAFPTLPAIDWAGHAMFFSPNYNQAQGWSITYSMTNGWWSILTMIPDVSVRAGGYDIKLTKAERKRLRKAMLPAMNRAQAEFKRLQSEAKQ